MKQIIFALVCSLLLMGCGGKSANTSPGVVDGLPCDTAWMISRGQSKTDVRNLFLTLDMRVDEREFENTLIGVSPKPLHWVGADWDIVLCRFDDTNKAQSVSIIREGNFDITEDSIYAIVYKLFCIYGDIGEPKLSNDNGAMTWRFLNSHSTTASITMDRSTEVNVIWE